MLTFHQVYLSAWEFLFRITYGWGHKILLAPPVIFYETVLGGDVHVLFAYGFVFLVDLAVGILAALKRREFSRKRLELWTVKLVVHALCVLLVGLIDLAIVRALRDAFHPPVLNLVVCVLLTGEVGSILANLQEMTGKVPPFLMRFSERVHEKAKRRFDDILELEIEHIEILDDDKTEARK